MSVRICLVCRHDSLPFLERILDVDPGKDDNDVDDDDDDAVDLGEDVDIGRADTLHRADTENAFFNSKVSQKLATF